MCFVAALRRAGGWLAAGARGVAFIPRLIHTVCVGVAMWPSELLKKTLPRSTMVGVGRLPGTVGMASCLLDAPPPRPATLEELKLRWITRLEERKASWRLALKEVFHRVDADGDGYATLDEFVKMVAATGNCFNQEEGMRLFEVWAGADSKIALNKVTADLSAILSLDESIFNRPDAPTCEGSVVSGSKSRSNLESADSGLKSIDDTSYVPRAISNRNLTAATKSRPLPVLGGAAFSDGGADAPSAPRAAGLARGAVSSATTSSVPGGIFAAANEVIPPPPPKGNRSNAPSISGGIFEDHSEDKPTPMGRVNRSQTSSVPHGNIFTAASRPVTVEYGYERFPRQGLN